VKRAVIWGVGAGIIPAFLSASTSSHPCRHVYPKARATRDSRD
jgi:hypothetical protein